MLDESSLGERGMRELVVESPSGSSLGGICRDSPLMWYVGLRGVVGSATAAGPSLEEPRLDSRNAGDGDNDGFGGSSDSDRALLDLGVSEPSSCSSCWVRLDRVSVPVARPGASIIVVDITRASESRQAGCFSVPFLCKFISTTKNHVLRRHRPCCTSVETATWIIACAKRVVSIMRRLWGTSIISQLRL